MEKKKLLLISISVGIFLVIIIGASILVFSPRETDSSIPVASGNLRPPIPAGASEGYSKEPAQPALVDPVELIRNSGETQSIQPAPAGSTAIQENNIYINGEPFNTDRDSRDRVARERASGGSGTQLVITIPPLINSSGETAGTQSFQPFLSFWAAPAETSPPVFTVPREPGVERSRTAIPLIRGPAPEPSRPAAPASRTAPEPSRTAAVASRTAPEPSRPAAPASRPAPEPARPAAPASRPAPKPARPAAPASRPAPARPTAPASRPGPARPAPAPKSTPAARVYDTYWVQTGSFSTQNRAEGVKETLASKGITSIVENRDVEGKIFYRVRVGPYASPHEADYWLALIKTIKGFENSQVWKSQARQ